MTKRNRFAALLAAVLALVLLFSVFFIAFESHHDCCGDDCAICAGLQFCGNLLRQLLLTVGILLSVRLLLTAALFAADRVFFRNPPGYTHY